MSNQLTLKKRVKYAPEQMARAIEAVKSGALSKKAAAKAFAVPRTTLLDKLAGRVPETATRPGKKPVLTNAEEATLVNYSKIMFEIGYPVTKREFLKEVKKVLDIDGRETPFKDNLPGYHWFNLFCKRNPQMTMRTPMGLGQERARINFEMVSGWFEGVKKYLVKEVPDFDLLLKNPRRIFNADESGFPLCAKSNKVMAPKGAHNVYQVVTNTKLQITVMAAFNAFGEYLPPLILFPGERLRDVGLSGFPEARYATTKSGWMDSDTFLSFLEMLSEFVDQQNIELPVLLFVDGHSTHLSLRAAEFCRDHKIVLYCLLPNATHVLQACDIGFFSPMKKVWQQTVKDWQVQNIGVAMAKKDFPALFKTTWGRVATFENAAHGFRKSGLFPFTVDGIDKTKLQPSRIIQEQHTVHLNQNIVQENDPEVGTVSLSKNTESKTQTVEQDACIQSTSIDMNQDNVAPAFFKLNVPEPIQKKKRNQLRDKLPKAISGTEAIQMLREKEEKRKAEEQAKLKRKEERTIKKAKKEEEKIFKKEERERKRKEKEQMKKDKICKGSKKAKKRVTKESESDSDDNNVSMNLVTSDSSDFEEEFEMCPACNKGDKHPSLWGRCLDCATRWHYSCANRPEFELLEEDERQKIEFICPLCL